MSKKQSVEMVELLTDLPPNILLEILVRLPLKNLFQSKCVCRTFRNLASPTPHFIQLHSSNAPQELIFQFGNFFEPSRIIRLLDSEFRRIEFRPIFQVPTFGRLPFNIYRTNYREVNLFFLVNSCNGLLYFVRRNTSDECSLVCNPVTREYKRIPDVDAESSNSRTKSMWLGFASGTNQFKVLRMFSSVRDEPVEIGAQVLVVWSTSWRNIGTPPLGSDLSWDTCSTFLDGHIYWFDPSRRVVVFFDFEREMFGDILLPPEFGEDKDCMTMGVLGDCLSLSYNDSSAHHVDIWVMKKPGNQESWSKEFVVDMMTPTSRLLYGQFKPLQIIRNGELLMLWISHDLISYDLKNKSFRFLGIDRARLNPKVVAFTPSFLPLKDALSVDKVLVQDVRPRGYRWDPSEQE